jgi:serine protease Do
VIKIEPGNLIAIAIGDSDLLEVGDFVLAIGNPLQLGQTVTSGIVSGLRRNNVGIEQYEDFIQTDAAIYPGNSGGALVNLHGQLVGINTAILAPGGGNIGIGFAVPINMARRVMEQLIRYGEVKRGRIGVAIQELTPELAQAMGTRRTEGAVIAKIEPRSSADRAGLKAGDLVVAVNGMSIRSATQLRNAIGLARVDDTIELVVERRGETRKLEARIDQVEAPAPAERRVPQNERSLRQR